MINNRTNRIAWNFDTNLGKYPQVPTVTNYRSILLINVFVIAVYHYKEVRTENILTIPIVVKMLMQITNISLSSEWVGPVT